MTALLVGTMAFGGVSAVGWYGYRAYLRIQTWGRNMDECDRIFQETAVSVSKWDTHVGRKRPPRSGISLVPPLKTPHPSA